MVKDNIGGTAVLDRPVTDKPSGPTPEQQAANADRKKQSATRLVNFFRSGKNYRTHAIVRSMVQELSKDIAIDAKAKEYATKRDALQAMLDTFADQKEALLKMIADLLDTTMTNLVECNDPGVRLPGGATTIEVAEAFLNFRGSASQRNEDMVVRITNRTSKELDEASGKNVA